MAPERSASILFHHQVVKDKAPGFAVTAVSSDGIIEAIERDNIIGVQWHPEAAMDMDFSGLC